MHRSAGSKNLWCTLAVALLLTSAFAGNASAAAVSDPSAFSLELLNVTYSNAYQTNAVTYYNYRLTWTPHFQNSPGLSHVDVQICSTLVPQINYALSTPGAILGDSAAPGQCQLSGFDSGSTIVKWQSSSLTLVSGHFDFTLAINGTYGAKTTHYVAFAGGECSPANGSAVDGPSCDTTVGCPNLPWCPPVCIPPAISAGPANQEICDTASPTAFSVTATGSSLSYQWSLGGQPIEGATGPTYTPPKASAGTYNYSVTVTGGCGTPQSASATLTVHQSASVAALSPANVCVTNTTASFTASATGEGTLTYAWTLDGNSVGTNSSSYSTPNNLSVGSHTVAVSVTGSSSFCGAASKSTTVTVHQSTAVSQLASQDSCEGHAATFTASATGEAPLSYAWTLDGSAVGTNSSSYSTPSNLSVGEHTVAVTVTGSSSCANASTSAKLTVHQKTAVADLGNQDACETNSAATFTASATGEGTLSYAWTLDGSAVGTNSSSYSTPNNLSIGAHTVGVTVSGSSSCANASTSATLTVHKKTTVSELSNKNACETNSATTFTASATGEGTLSYAWTLDGSAVGTNSSSYTTPSNLSVGDHTVAVSVTGATSCASASTSATLTVHQKTAVADLGNQDSCETDTAATFTASATGEGTLSYAWTLDGNSVGTNSSSYSTPNNLSIGAHTVGVTVSGSSSCANASTSATLTVHKKTTVSELSNKNACETNSAATFSVTGSGEGTLTYAWTLDGSSVGTNSSSYTTPADLSVGDHTVAVSVSGATSCASASTSAKLTVHQKTAVADLSNQDACETNSAATFTASATGEGTLSYAWTLDGNAVGTDSSSYSTPNNLSIGAHTVVVTVTGSSSCATASTSATLTVHKKTTVSELSNKNACETNSAATFSVTATGEGTLTYAWTLDGSAVGTNSSSYTTPSNLSVGDHTVAVSVSGATSCASASTSAKLTVHQKTAVADLANQDACETNSAATFTASATGEGTLSYAWTLDGNAVGTNSNSYSTPNNLSVGAHTVVVTVTGSSSCATASTSATLTVHQKTSVADIASQQSCEGNAATFTASATGEGTLSYQWKLDGNNAGTNSSSYTTPANLSAGSHTISVTVTGAASCASATASTRLTVHAKTTVAALSPKESCSAFTTAFSATATGESLSYAWSLDGNAVGTNSASYLVPSGLSAGDHTVSVTVTGASQCDPVTRSAKLTIKDCPPTCTLTQGAWGSSGGAGDVTSLTAAIGGGLTVGSGSNTFTVSSSPYDVNCTIQRLPAGGSPAALPAGANGFASSNCLTTAPQRTVKAGKVDGMLSGNTSKDKFNNVLLGQTLTLSLNLRNDANLPTTQLCKYMKVSVLNGTSTRTLDSVGGIPQKVWDDLGANPTITSLLQLANSYLGGSVKTASYAEVNQAVTAMNELFDACPTKRYVVTCLPSAPIQLSSGVTQLAAGVTPIGLCTASTAIGTDGSIADVTIPSSILRVMTTLGLNTELRGFVQLRQMVREGYDNLSFDELNVAIGSLNEAVAQQRTIVPCSDR